METCFCDKSGELVFQFLGPLWRWSSLCLSLGYLNLSLCPASPPLSSFVCLAVHPPGWDAMGTTSFLLVRDDVAEVLSLPVQAVIAGKAFFLLKQKANCPVPAGANVKLVLLAGWEGSASRFVGENPASWLMSWASQPSVAGLLENEINRYLEAGRANDQPGLNRNVHDL